MIYIYSLDKEPRIIRAKPRDLFQPSGDEGTDGSWTIVEVHERVISILLEMRDSGELLDYDDDSIGIRFETCPRCVGDQCNNSKEDEGALDGAPDYNDQEEYNTLYTHPGTCAYTIDMQELYSGNPRRVIVGLDWELDNNVRVIDHVYLIGRKRDEDRSYNPYKDSGGRFYFNKTIRRYIDGKHEKLMDELFLLYDELEEWAKENNGSVYEPPDYLQEDIDHVCSQFDFMEEYHQYNAKSFPMSGLTFAEAMSAIPYAYEESTLGSIDKDPRIMRPYETDEGEIIIEDAKVIAIIK